MRAVRADHLRVYEYLAQRLLPMTGGGYLADGTPPEVHKDLSAAINAQASQGWELDRFVPQGSDIWLVFRRTNASRDISAGRATLPRPDRGLSAL